MDLPCLIGVCAAAAQAVTAVEPAAAQEAAQLAGEEAARRELKDISDLVTWLGIAVLLVAQFGAPPLLRFYRPMLLKFMNASSHTMLGVAAIEPRGALSAQDLLDGMERQRLLVLHVLIGVVVLYSVAAAWLYAFGFDSASAFTLSLLVSFFLFAAFSGPVVLLGVSAANFGRHFWTYFAPAAFAAVAMQIVVGGAAQVGAGDEDPKLLPMLGAIALLTLVAVAIRELVPAAWWSRAWAWIRSHRIAALLIGLLLLFLLGLGLDDGAEELTKDVKMKEGFLQKLAVGCALAAVAITLCYFTIVDRSKRIVVPLLAAAMFTVVALSFVITMVLAGEGDGLQTLIAISVGMGISLLLAYFMLSWIGLAYEQKIFSDAQFQVSCWMVSVAGVVIFAETLINDSTLGDPVNRRLMLATLIAMLAYWALIRWLGKPMLSDRRLLVLRVFGHDSRGERLLDEIEYRWRFIGPIVLIGGPDIAVRTIDPAKAANFLRGKLKGAFVPNRMVLHKRVAAMDDAPDPDGRYRVNEFYCFDDLWKEAVQLLLDSSDAIVLDLRGFTAERRGTAYEIGLLANRGALARTVFLVNESTDMDAVHQALHTSQVSDLPAGSVIQVESVMDGKLLVEALVRKMPDVSVDAPPPLGAVTTGPG